MYKNSTYILQKIKPKKKKKKKRQNRGMKTLDLRNMMMMFTLKDDIKGCNMHRCDGDVYLKDSNEGVTKSNPK
jgi:outer membrane scaffolding protein for murein synthesis (MipA/OmpV family)